MRQTPLARMLAEPTSRPDALTAFKLARTWFTDGRRIDMGKLAGELGVSRATLFRWVGSRDDLLSAVVWSLTDPTLSRAEHEAAQGSGGRRIADVMERFCELVITSEFFGTFLQREPERALRLFTTRAMPFQGQFVARVEQLLLQQIRTGALEPPLATHDLAYLIVRIGESYIYSDLITGEAPDATKVRMAIAALLR